MTLNLDQIETDLAAGRTDHRTVRQLIEEVKRLRAEVERLTSPRPGFLTWLNELADRLPLRQAQDVAAGTVLGVSMEKLQRWHEAGVTAEGAAEEVARRGQRVRGEGL